MGNRIVEIYDRKTKKRLKAEYWDAISYYEGHTSMEELREKEAANENKKD